MANVFEPSPEQVSKWNAWVQERPEAVRAVADKIFPWKLYRIISTGHRVTVVSFDEHEDGHVTCRVVVGGEFNLVAFEREVFGIDPEDLVECDLPSPAELRGSLNLSVEFARSLAKITSSPKVPK